jgi:NAD(P)-dependent dehydrogenase (short-subunit alcohol dehydrogenase family)
VAFDNAGRVAVVTGGAKGIGLAIARRFLADGMSVAILDIDPELPQVVESLGERATGYICDITSVAAVRRTAAAIAKSVGEVGVLVNNAGIAKKGAFLDISPATQRDILAVNLIATLDVTRAFLPSIIAAPCGRVIMMSSDGARVGVPRESIYTASKAGVVGFAKSLAVEVAKTDTTVNCISPGPIDTPLLHDLLTAEQLEHRTRQNPMRRFGSVEEVAALAAYLASPEAGYVSGQVMSINGALIRVD